ncbi:YfhS protein [Desmospora sp. 8437]|nr:YfhS protein [Desmospora sp. 8437]
MYSGRMMDELTDVPLPEWDMNELSHQHLSLSRMAPFLNQQGIHLHQRIIREIERRGGFRQETADHPANDGKTHNEHRFTF